MPIFFLPRRSFVSHLGPVVSSHNDARTFASSLCVCVSLCVSVSLAWGQGHGRAQADTGPCLSCVISWFPSSTFLICLLGPWRRQAFASLASPGQSRPIRLGLLTPNKSQEMSRTAVICERSHIATTASANKYTDAASFFFTGGTFASLLGTTLLHLQGQTPTLTPSPKLN